MTLLNLGISGLKVSQTALQVTGNNIANADRPEYSRQRIETATLPERLTGFGFIGSGARIDNIDRVVDEFLINQVRRDTSSFNRLQVFTSNIEQIDSLLADDVSGLGPVIREFYSAVESSAQDPSSEPARQVVVSQAQTLTQRINSLVARTQQQSIKVNTEAASFTAQVATLAESLAQVNISIATESGRGSGGQPNLLLDKREALLLELSEFVNVSTVQNGTSVDVFVGNGLPLVVGGEAAKMSTAPSQSSPGDVEITFVGGNGIQQTITSLISGGRLGGVLETRETVNDSLNALGRLAISIADTLNRQNSLGLDLDGNIGGNIFRDINDGNIPQQRAITDARNSDPNNQSLSVNIVDVSQLTTSDYTVTVFDNNGAVPLDYRIIRESDGATTIVNGVAGAQSLTLDGFRIDISAATQGNLAADDRFVIRPTRTGGTDLAMAIQRVEDLAYATPIVTEAKSGNTGQGVVSQGEMLAIVTDTGTGASIQAAPNPIYSAAGVLAGEILIRFTSATSYTVYENSNGLQPFAMFSGTIIPGQANTIFSSTPGDANYIGFQMEISGIPAAGDEFTVAANSNGFSDNRNALALGETRNRNILDGGTTNFENTYGKIIERLGTRTAQAQANRDAAESLLAQTTNNRDAISGVNLDEEAANLIKFEQSYNAAARLISVARDLFDTLIAAVR